MIKKFIKHIVGFIAGAMAALFLFFMLNSKSKKKSAEEIEKEKKDELEKKSADDIAADSPNPDTISTNIEREQEELRERIRDRLEKNIPGNRSSSDN
ncbi:MAG: hypothetical protein IJL70_00515 [Treponema sp.]|nr:hypothetical protein [bacterium]MBQ5997937.1 hypothetical protein [Treponema sp.]MBQ6056330.1 hypothetical protein [Treponema sp.]